jgi:hypothetical protein
VIHLAHHVLVTPSPPMKWEGWLASAGNPNIPTVEEVLGRIFTTDERALFERYARPQLEDGGRPTRSSIALLSATKGRAA